MTSSNQKKRFDVPTVVILRHDKTKFNTDSEETSRLKGTKYDLPLTAEGKAKARKDALKLKNYDIASITTSAMQRSKQSAEPLENISGVSAVSTADLNPWDVGYLAGHTRASAKERIEYYIEHSNRAVPEGESYKDFWDTFTAALARKMAQAVKEDGRGVVIVTHSCGLLAAEAFINGNEPRPHVGDMPEPGSISLLQKHGKDWILEFDFLGSGETKQDSEAGA